MPYARFRALVASPRYSLLTMPVQFASRAGPAHPPPCPARSLNSKGMNADPCFCDILAQARGSAVLWLRPWRSGADPADAAEGDASDFVTPDGYRIGWPSESVDAFRRSGQIRRAARD